MYHTVFGKALKIRGQNYKQNLPKNCSKSTKMAITVSNFQICFGRACPRTSQESFLLLKLLEINSDEKNNA